MKVISVISNLLSLEWEQVDVKMIAAHESFSSFHSDCSAGGEKTHFMTICFPLWGLHVDRDNRLPFLKMSQCGKHDKTAALCICCQIMSALPAKHGQVVRLSVSLFSSRLFFCLAWKLWQIVARRGPDERPEPLPVFSKVQMQSHIRQQRRKISTFSNLGNKLSYIYSFSTAQVTESQISPFTSCCF